MSDSDRQAPPNSPPEHELPAELIAQEARLQGLGERPAGRDAELAQEAARLNDAVREAAHDLEFDDQPGDFLALLIALREPEDRLR